MKMIHIGDVQIELNDYAVGRSAILGITKSGKTYTAKGIVEQLMDHGVQPVIFDAIGVWRHLKTAGEGSGAKGYPIVVAGGASPDLPLTPQSAPEIVRAAIRENIPLVIDLYDARLSKADWRRIVQQSFRVLLYENKGLRHVVLEESAEFAPQKVMDGETYAEVEKLARMGGNASVGITFINQRAQELNKAVLELCDNIVLLRQRGSHAIDSLEKWLDRLSPDEASSIAQSMPQMGQGDCWVFSEKAETAIRTRSRRIRSFHPDRKNPVIPDIGRSVPTVDFVRRMSGELEKVIAQAKDNDPSELKAKIRQLERQLANKTPVKAEPEKVSVLTDEDRKLLNRVIDMQGKAVLDSFEKLQSKTMESIRDMRVFFEEISAKISTALPQRRLTVQTTVRKPSAVPAIRRPVPTDSTGEIGRGAREILRAAAQHDDGVTDEQLAVLTGYKKTSRTTFKQQLFSKGYLARGGRGYVATGEGIAWLGPDFEPLPVGDALRKHWLRRLSGGELALFEIYVEAYPDEVPVETLMERTGYQKTSITTFRQKLSARNLICGKKASANLFT